VRARIDAITGRLSMYRWATITLSVVLATGVALAFLDAIGPDPYGILGIIGVVIVATIGANEVAARLARVVPHRESAVITGLIISCIVQPSLDTAALIAAAGAGIIASLSKYLLVWRGRHVLNPAATGVFVAGFVGYFLGQGVGFWWIATGAMLPIVALGALVLLDRSRRLDVGLVFIVITVVLISARLLTTGSTPWGAPATVFTLFPVVFLAGFMLSEPLTLPPRRWQQWLAAAVAGLVFSVPFSFGPLYTSPELALIAGNLVAFAVSRRTAVSLRLRESTALSPHAVEHRFDLTRPLRFEAGQYLELHVPHRADIRGLRRVFSIASPPSAAQGEHPHLAVAMRTPDKGSSFKAALASLEPGTRIAVTQIAGDFVLPRDPSVPLLLVAGGIGMTPFASQLAELAARGERRDIVVLVVPSYPGEVLFVETIAAAGAKLEIVSAEQLTVDALRTLVPDLAERRAFVSGAPAVVSAATAALRAAGARRVRTDYFVGY